MKALVKFAKDTGNVELREVQEPVCGADQVKLEVAWCGVCGTDLHVYHDTFRNYPPVILGHEISAVIVEVGKNVRGFTIGGKYCVLGASTVTCGSCVYCRQGQFMFCPSRRGMGHGVDGGFTRYILARPDQLFPIPENVSLEEGALCEPFAASVHAVCELTPLRAGDVALISGPGPMGLLALKLLVSQRIKTIVAGTDADVRRLELAGKLGAHSVVNVSQQDLAEHIKDETDGYGVDVAVECAGAASSVKSCLSSIRPLGHYTQVGHFGRDVTIPLDFLGFKQIRMSGSVGYTVETWIRMLKILEEGNVRLGDVITHKFSLEEWQNGFAACENKSALKVILRP